MGIKHYSMIHFHLSEILREIETRFYKDDSDGFDDDWVNFVEDQPNFIGESTSFEINTDNKNTIGYYISVTLKENGMKEGDIVYLDITI